MPSIEETVAARGTGQGGQFATATVAIDPSRKRQASDFTERDGGSRGPESPWRQQLVDLVAMVNMRDADGQRAVDIGEYVCIGRFRSKYGARNRMRKYEDKRLGHLPFVDGFTFAFKFEYVHQEDASSELWAALVAKPLNVAAQLVSWPHGYSVGAARTSS